MEIEQYKTDLLKAIKTLGQYATESNIYRKLDKKWGYKATFYFNDAINDLELSNKILRMTAGGRKTWEII